MSAFLYYLGFSLLIAHEIDAAIQREWKLLYIFRRLPEQSAIPYFVALHVPLFTLLLYLTNHDSNDIQQSSRLAIALFLIIHAALHKRLEPHALYKFHSPLSKGLIYGGGLVGFAYCMLMLTA
ncbi:MAG: DUF6713 family protein [Phormidesmis sp.]